MSLHLKVNIFMFHISVFYCCWRLIDKNVQSCADPDNFVRGGPNLIFLIDGGREDPNTTLIWPASARQRNAIEMAFRWRADDGPTLNAGLVTL